jgi:hypothetical protein
MPLAVTEAGEGVFVAPSPRRTDAATPLKQVKRLRMFRVWWDYRRAGMSYRDICECTSKPESTVRAGIAEFAAYLDLVRAEYAARADLDLRAIVPAFGPSQYTPASCRQKKGSCAHCDNPIRFDLLSCPYCEGMSGPVEREIRRRAQAEEGRARAIEHNRELAGPPSPAQVKRWDEIEEEQKAEAEAEAAAKSKPSRRRKAKPPATAEAASAVA